MLSMLKFPGSNFHHLQIGLELNGPIGLVHTSLEATVDLNYGLKVNVYYADTLGESFGHFSPPHSSLLPAAKP